MNVIVSKDDLSTGLQLISRAVSPKSALPILSGVYLEYKKGMIHLIGTDLELGIETYIPAESASFGEEEGEGFRFVVAARYITDIARRLPGESVELSFDNENNTLSINAGNARYSMNAIDPDEFPSLPTAGETRRVTINQSLLRNMIRNTTFACSTDDVRMFLSGSFLQIFPDEVRMIATDSFRMALFIKKSEFNISEPVEVIIPSKSLNELMRVLDINEESTIDMILSERHVFFELENTKFISRIIDAQYPNYTRYMRSDYDTRIEVDTGKLLGAVERASVMAENNFSGVKIVVKEGRIEILTNTPQIGNAFDSIEVDQEGENCSVALRWRYLFDVLRICEEDTIAMEFKGAVGPVVIRFNDMNYMYIIMPFNQD